MDKRIDSYKRKLLDTGRRNRLINFKKSYISTVELITDDFYKLYEELTNGQVFTFAKLFDELDDFIDLDESEVKDRLANALGKTVYYKKRYDSAEIEEIRTRFKPLKGQKYVYSSSVTNLMNRVLLLLKKKSQLYYEETGVNALYLCFGFLNYKEEKQDYLAPLVLVPVSLHQKTIQDNFKIKALDEDYNLNENLIHKFNQEYKIDLKPNKEDMKLDEYLAYVNAKVSKLGFSVDEEVWLGLFSFSKIMLYRDISSNDDLIKNSEVIKAFCDKPSKLNQNQKLQEINLDYAEDISSQNQVLYADSSQYKSIYYAKKGLSFVLQGPPGTGKSQTITNILAELIGQDKKVLFVCEKKSALEVVYRNLKKKSLDIYALPLFDTKVNKKDIVKGIYENLVGIQDNRVTMSEKAKEILSSLDNSKKEFGNYLDTITTKLEPINLSLYDIVSLIEKYDDAPLLDFTIRNVLNVSDKAFKDYLNKISYFSAVLKTLGDKPEEHPFYLFNRNKLSLSEANSLKKSFKECYDKIDILIKALQVFREKLSIEINSFDHFQEVISFIEALTHLKHVDEKYLEYTNLTPLSEALDIIIKNYKENQILKKEFMSKYKLSFLDLDSEALLTELKEKYNTKLKRAFGFKKLDSMLEDYLLVKRNLKYDEEISDLEALNKYKKNYYETASKEILIKEKFEELYFGSLTNFDELKELINSLACVEKAKNYVTLLKPIKEVIALSNEEENSLFIEITKAKLIDSFNNSIDGLKALNEYFDYDLTKENPLLIYKRLKLQLFEFERVNEYIDFIKAYQQIDSVLNSFKKEALIKKVKADELTNAFIKRFMILYLDEYFLTHQNLESYTNTYLNKLLMKYQINDNKMFEIAKTKIKENVTNSWPQLDSIMSNNYEVKTLVSEANKKRKLKTLRVLFNEIPHILKDLKPIIMSSPLSVATYLDPNKYHFDCVIFDEASQITAENAIGAMYRSDQVIIVGDNEQLPPTSFFDSVDDEEDEEDYNIYESILDQALVTLPKIMLKWHYRSKDESLITFSNNEIYHDLTSFPSFIQSENLGVKYVYVEDAIYEHGKRVNMKEAKKVVDLVIEHIKVNPSKSLGVVTFNMAQQAYIERLINKQRILDPTIEEFFNEDKIESFFVKNLETVQGDERDVIILSTTFGKDEKNKISMNFGPINKDGGYRRLNVAITRAKEKVILCSSMRPSDFKMESTNNRGVIMLHDYIDFASKAYESTFLGNDEIDGVISSINKQLNEKGYKTVTNLGCSGYHIDLAVKSPFNENEFALAILSDGKNYQALKTIRDKNHLMDEVLKQRGWKLLHVWSLNYEKNKTAILDEILKLINDGYKEEKYLDKEPVQFEIKTEKNELKVEELFSFYPDAKKIINDKLMDLADKITTLDLIVNELAPIKIDELKKLVLPLYGKSRLSDSVSLLIDKDIEALMDTKKYYKVIGFILKSSNLYGVSFRRYQFGLYYPDVNDIYVEELENGFEAIISKIKTSSRKILFQTFNELVGYAKGSTLTFNTFDNVLNILQDKGVIKVDKEFIEYIGN